MSGLETNIQTTALQYWNDTADEELDKFPISIVKFVLEYAIGYCHFPPHFDEDKIDTVMGRYVNSLAMACVDVYAKAGAEGEKSHSENGILRTYSDSYIDKALLDKLPNYVTVL